ncbi:MAG: DUF3021 family protein [Ruminococcaceae bacterium]|nr:DUF3021 family protein [Oscillospiraceae bacterium]
MMLLKKLYREILLPACLITTILCFISTAVLQLSDTKMDLPMVNLSNLTQIFLFSFIFAASWQLFSLKKLSFWAALALHFLCFLANLTVVFFLIGDNKANPFMVLFVFGLIYVVIATVAVTVRQVVKAQKNASKPYRRQF